MDTLDIAFAEARRYLASLDTRPVASRGSPAEMLAGLPARFPEHGMAAADVVRVGDPGKPYTTPTLSLGSGPSSSLRASSSFDDMTSIPTLRRTRR
jgi:hypothetical protein